MIQQPIGHVTKEHQGNPMSTMKTTVPEKIAQSTAPAQTRDHFSRLMAAVASRRDEQAFAEIYDYYAGRVKSFLMGRGMNEDTAEDLMQEIMLIVWRRADSFDPLKAAPSTWIFTIARNRRIDHLRGNSRIEVELDDELLDIETTEPTQMQQIINAQSATLLENAIDRLPVEQQQVMHLSFYRGQSHGAIAAWLDLPVGTVKSRIRLATQNVRGQLIANEDLL